MIQTGIINLSRKTANFEAGYCILKEEITTLKEKQDMLHLKEMEYFRSLKYERRQASYLLGRLATKNAITQIKKNITPTAIQIDSGIFEFPVVVSEKLSNIQVGISHSETIGIALAFPEKHPLGIDIEKIEIENSAVIKGLLSEIELKQIDGIQCSKVEGYTAVWSIKEALSKVLKTGLTADFKILEIKELVRNGDLLSCEFRHFGQYKAISCIQGNYLCSIVMPKNTTTDLSTFWIDFRNIVHSHFTGKSVYFSQT